MTLVMAPVLAAGDELARPLYTENDGLYCGVNTCGLVVVDLPGGGWAHVDRCASCPPAGPCPETSTTHRLGSHEPYPADCGHQQPWCGYAVLPHHCQRGEDNCCGCCHHQ